MNPAFIMDVLKTLGLWNITMLTCIINLPSILLTFNLFRKDRDRNADIYVTLVAHKASMKRLDRLQDSVEQLVKAIGKMSNIQSRHDERLKYLDGVREKL